MPHALDRRAFLRATAAATLAAALGSRARAAERPPNIVVLFADDLGYGDLGCYGSTTIATPRLDRMAREGARFTDFYVTCSVCSPSRAGLLTGRYQARSGVYHVLGPNAATGLPPEEVTIATMLRRAGYATGCVGKWHLGDAEPFRPLRHGFDRYFGLLYSNDMWPQNTGSKTVWPTLELYEGDTPIEVIDSLEQQALLTRRYTDYALDFIRDHRERPFFLYLPYAMPHVPIAASTGYRGTSRGGLYGDVIQEIDGSVGRLLDNLDALGLREDTLVVFTSDNGPWLAKGDHAGRALPLRDGKMSCFEGGVRVPAIMRWPGHIAPRQTLTTPAITVDLLPTVAALTGAAAPADRPLDGDDISALLLRGEAPVRTQPFYWYRGDRLWALREGRWKLHIRRGKNDLDPLELYDLDADVAEATNVAAQHPDVVQRLAAQARAFEAELAGAG